MITPPRLMVDAYIGAPSKRGNGIAASPIASLPQLILRRVGSRASCPTRPTGWKARPRCASCVTASPSPRLSQLAAKPPGRWTGETGLALLHNLHSASPWPQTLQARCLHAESGWKPDLRINKPSQNDAPGPIPALMPNLSTTWSEALRHRDRRSLRAAIHPGRPPLLHPPLAPRSRG